MCEQYNCIEMSARPAFNKNKTKPLYSLLSDIKFSYRIILYEITTQIWLKIQFFDKFPGIALSKTTPGRIRNTQLCACTGAYTQHFAFHFHFYAGNSTFTTEFLIQQQVPN